MRSCNNRLVAIFLAVFVLFAQHGASLHALSHATQDVADGGKSSPDRQGPSGHENCEQCLSFAAAGSALTDNKTFSLHSFTHVASAHVPVAQPQRRTITAYHSRAPPKLLV